MTIEHVVHQGAPSPRGPYSSAVRAGGFIFISALGPIGDDDKLSPGSVRHQARVVLTNMQKILGDCGATLEDVVKCSVFLRDIHEFPLMNEVYAEFLGLIKPARTTVQAAFVHPDVLVMMDCVAYRP